MFVIFLIIESNFNLSAESSFVSADILEFSKKSTTNKTISSLEDSILPPSNGVLGFTLELAAHQ